MNNKVNLFIKKYKLFILLFLVVSVTSLIVFYPSYSDNNTSTIWDGTVASSFESGTGTMNDPFVISSGSHLALLSKYLEDAEQYPKYYNKYYVINTNINMNNILFNMIGDLNKPFSGSINGYGHYISNINLNSSSINNNILSLGLFAKLDNASIINLNLDSISIELNDITSNYVSFLATEVSNSIIKNISINSSIVSIKDNVSTSDSYIGGLLTFDLGNNNIDNIVLNNSYNVTLNTANIIYSYLDSTLGKFIVNNNNISNVYNNSSVGEIYLYSFNNDIMTFNNNNIDDVLLSFNSGLGNQYEWVNNNGLITLASNDNYVTYDIVSNESGIVNSTLFINDLEADYDLYSGLNYTYSFDDGLLPEMNDQNLYNKNNLVKAQVTYNGIQVLSDGTSLIGNVSISENVNKYVYYKYYVSNDNGTPSDYSDDYIEIELIDNPFSDHPNNKGFNGWITNYLGAIVSFDKEVYVRYAKVPISYSNGIPNDVVIEFNATWIDAKVSTLNDSWSNAFSSLDYGIMQSLSNSYTYNNFDLSGYYTKNYITRNNNYTGYLQNGNAANNTRCSTASGCVYYTKLTSSDTFDFGTIYYELINNDMVEADTTKMNITVASTTPKTFTSNENMAGFFSKVIINQNESIVGYYDLFGQYINSGICNNISGCTYYKLEQYYDELGYQNIYDANKEYFYLATRDTNIVVLNQTINSVWTSSENKPFTLTSVYNDIDYRNSAYLNLNIVNGTSTTYYSVHSYADTTIENVYIYSVRSTINNLEVAAGISNQLYLYGDYYNLKVGRGILRNGNYVNFSAIIGGSNTSVGSTNKVKKYRLIVESGRYTSGSLSSGYINNDFTTRINGTAIYGSDYDRVTGNNDNFSFHYCVAQFWGGVLYSSNSNEIGLTSIYKSGSFGTSRQENTTGTYVGSRHSGTTYAPKMAIIQGGWFYNVVGGPQVASSRGNLNDLYLFITGGTITSLQAGAGRNATYGNRIIQMTGGTIEYNLFGGSNAFQANSGTVGILYGSSYIYVGGQSVIGTDANVNNNRTIYNAEAGSIFGHGAGMLGATSVGSNNNSYIIIDGNALIKRNIYGGGNNGIVGYVTPHSSSESKILVLNGTINGSVYGSGNNNGSGSSSKPSNTYIDVYNGLIKGSVYGGSNSLGTILGSTHINIQGGVIEGSIYGGGQGGYSSASSIGTYVRDSVSIIIGSDNNSPTIGGNIYGGSALGTVNATSISQSANSNKIDIIINNGKIAGSVFGGAQGSSSITPRVKGNITVTINGGTMESVYGGFDVAGTPENNSTVYLNGGTIGSAYGGGNQTNMNTTNIYLQGSNVTNIYGGSNQKGIVENTNVYIKDGNVSYVYGGNNLGDACSNTNVVVTGGNIKYELYGGGNIAPTYITNIDLVTSNKKIPSVYGGGKSADVISTIVNAQNIDVTSMYGGSNNSGEIKNTKVIITGGYIDDIFGGNNAGGTVDNTEVIINVPNIGNVYGGGDKAITNTSYINVLSGNINNLYGGGNESRTAITNIDLNGGVINNVFGAGNKFGSVTTNVNAKSGTITNLYGGSNISGTVTESHINTISDSSNNLIITNLYGGNNLGGITNTTNVDIGRGQINELYGGGNEAETDETNVNITGGTFNTIYGGGNKALINNNTNVNINNALVNTYVYGGGNDGQVNNNTNVIINNTAINRSAYAGGNGSTAIVNGNTNISIGGTTYIGTSDCTKLAECSVFGGGNAANTGLEQVNTSTAKVEIVGSYITGNVYGGANTAVVYGNSVVDIGDYVSNTNLTKAPITINGTVFGGGEANANGSTEFTYAFISVTNGIDVNISSNSYNEFNIEGSIFGSGNASSTSGTSIIRLKDYGTFNDPEFNTSIQRTNQLIVDNSAVSLVGATDRTNEYSEVLFSLSLIDELILTNNSTLFLDNTTNLLKSLRSTTKDGELQTVIIDDETGTVTKNVDNRIYIYEGKCINIALNESVTNYGSVYGMTFFGMFKKNSDGSINTGIYDISYNYGDLIDWADITTKGSYVEASHKLEHDINVDGFYSNFPDPDTGINQVSIITPTPEDSNFYRWIIGEALIEYNIDLIASKYSTLGTVELPFRDFTKNNTSFSILGFDYGELATGVSLLEENDVPRIASSDDIADNNMALVIKSSNNGWLNKGQTTLLSREDNNIIGTKTYIGENTTIVPTLLFYLYHSKNLSTASDMGTVKIVLMASSRIDDLTVENSRLVINVNLSRALYDTNDYEGAITAGRQYSLFGSTSVNITSKSAFSAYYSLYKNGDNIYKTGYHRALISSYVLPLNTKITMIDLSTSNPTYYYHNINSNDVTDATSQLLAEGDISYKFSDFELMGSTNSDVYYNDEDMNKVYYNDINKTNSEEFIFIIDFSDATINTDQLNNSIYIELRDSEEETINSLIGAQYSQMIYNIYANKDAIIDILGSIDRNTVYAGESATLDLETIYTQSRTDNQVIINDTKYFDSKLGIMISLIDENNEVITGTSLMGLYFVINDVKYYPNIDGTTRIKLADKVGNVNLKVRVYTENCNISTGMYNVKIESFGSPDGIYYGTTPSDILLIPVYIINEIYGFDVDIEKESLLINKDTGTTLNDSALMRFNIYYNSSLSNPSIYVRLYRRNYNEVYDTSYTLVNLQDYVTDELVNGIEENQYVAILTPELIDNQYLALITPKNTNLFNLTLNTNLLPGTYKMNFELYDGNTFIGDVPKYIIIE